jgi:hypothetical protein
MKITASYLIAHLECDINSIDSNACKMFRKKLRTLEITELNDQQFETILSLLQCTTMSDAIIKLDISFNQLTALPAEIGQLLALQKLNVSYNQLTALPAEIGQLVALQKLEVQENQLTTLPVTLEKCIALYILDISYNQQLACRPTIAALKDGWKQEVYRNMIQRKNIINLSLTFPESIQTVLFEYMNDDPVLSALSTKELRLLGKSVNPEVETDNFKDKCCKDLFNNIVNNNLESFQRFEHRINIIDVNTKFMENDGVTLLHAAAQKNVAIEFTIWLLNHGANPNQMDSGGWTPVARAVLEDRHDILAVYQKFRGKVDNATWKQVESVVAACGFTRDENSEARSPLILSGSFQAAEPQNVCKARFKNCCSLM